jgi:ATP-dependent DNA ligase
MVPRRESDELAVSIEYRAITADGRTRHGSFKGVREDLMEQPKQPRRN